MGDPTSIDDQNDLTCPNCLKPGMLVLDSTLPFKVLYCPQCDFAVKEPNWRRERRKKPNRSS
jgi:hypothetical protein